MLHEREIIRYHLEDRTTPPKFEYFIFIDGVVEKYWLFNDFDQAIRKMLALSNTEHRRICILEPEFVNCSREWRMTQTFHARDGKLYRDKFSRTGLHAKFYCDAGEWQNPEDLRKDV